MERIAEAAGTPTAKERAVLDKLVASPALLANAMFVL
jgi:hypothetical protein